MNELAAADPSGSALLRPRRDYSVAPSRSPGERGGVPLAETSLLKHRRAKTQRRYEPDGSWKGFPTTGRPPSMPASPVLVLRSAGGASRRTLSRRGIRRRQLDHSSGPAEAGRLRMRGRNHRAAADGVDIAADLEHPWNAAFDQYRLDWSFLPEQRPAIGPSRPFVRRRVDKQEMKALVDPNESRDAGQLVLAQGRTVAAQPARPSGCAAPDARCSRFASGSAVPVAADFDGLGAPNERGDNPPGAVYP